MAKIAVSLPDSTLKKIDDLSNTKGITRSKFVTMALDFYSNGAQNYKNNIEELNSQLAEKTTKLKSLSGEVLPLRENVHTLENTVANLTEQLDSKNKELEALSIEVLPLRENVHTMSNTLADKEREIGTRANEVFQKDKRIHTLENQLAETQKRLESLSKEVLLARDEGMKIKEELEKSRAETTKYEIAFKSQQADIEFLRGHVAQLTQQISVLALPPAKEEAKAKHLWQFWR